MTKMYDPRYGYYEVRFGGTAKVLQSDNLIRLLLIIQGVPIKAPHEEIKLLQIFPTSFVSNIHVIGLVY